MSYCLPPAFVVLVLFIGIAGAVSAADFTVYQEKDKPYAEIDLTGTIEPGDRAKFQNLYSRIEASTGSTDEWPVHVYLTSPGGSYIEGILLGEAFHTSGVGTYVRKGAECFSACAMAFLGGTFLGASAGWGPSRHLELGGKLGFHSFYLDKSSAALRSDQAVDIGKVLALMAVGYAKTINIDMGFIIKSLGTHPEDILLINTASLLRSLGIEVTGANPLRSVTDRTAVNLCNYATDWKRPVNLQKIFRLPDALTARGGTSPAVIHTMGVEQLQRHMLETLSSAAYLKGPITELIRHALQTSDPHEIARVFDDATKLEILPSLGAESRILHVSGFDYGHGFWVSDCFVIPHDEGSDQFGVDVILQSAHIGRSFEHKNFSKRGSVIYEMLDPDTVLLPIGNPTSGSSGEGVVRAFYTALGKGDGESASVLVVPEKRATGPLAARELTAFYSHMAKPLRLTEIDPAGQNLFAVKYDYTMPNGRFCDGKSLVTVVTHGGTILIEKIQSGSGC